MKINAKYTDTDKDTIRVSNYGNVPIEKIQLKLISSSGYDIEEDSQSIRGGNFITIDKIGIVKDFSDYDSIVVIPVLRGISDSGEKQDFVCDERHGVEV